MHTGKQPTPGRRPEISVIVPVKDGERDIVRCITALRDSSWTPAEILVVDDGSTDRTAKLARSLGARVISLPINRGPAFARNRGAELARGDVLFFTDADVSLHPDALAMAAACFAEDPELSAVIGSYDDAPACSGFVGRYKNLFHHWVHQHSGDEASTFWTGCGAVRREVFLRFGGFDESYPRPSIEDIELGFRLHAEQHRIRLEKRMLATHMKAWRLGNLLYTDVFLRGVPWIALMMRARFAPADLNLSLASRVATLLTAVFALLLVALPVLGHAAALLPTAALALATWIAAGLADRRGTARAALALAGMVALPAASFWVVPDPIGLLPVGLWLAIAATHPGLYAFFVRSAGPAFAVGVLPMHLLFQVCCLVSVPLGVVSHWRSGQPARSALQPLRTSAQVGSEGHRVAVSGDVRA